MLVDAEAAFAKRAAEWMLKDDNLSAEDMIARVGLWPKSFQKMIADQVKEHNERNKYYGEDGAD